MAGSSITNPRKSGSIKRLIGAAGLGGLNQGTGNPSGMSSTSVSGMRQAAPGTRRPEVGTAVAQPPVVDTPTKTAPISFGAGTRNERDALTAKVPQVDYSGWKATQVQQPVEAKPHMYQASAGSGMVRAQGEQRGGDRTGVEVIGAGGTPIRVDRNQEIAGAPTREREQRIQTEDPNSEVYYQQPAIAAAPALAKGVPAETGLAPIDINKPLLTGTDRQVAGAAEHFKPFTEEERQAAIAANQPAASASGISTSAAGLAPTGTKQSALTSTAQTTEKYPNPGGVYGAVWDKLSDVQKETILKLGGAGKGQSKFDEYLPTRYDTVENPVNGKSIDKSDEYLHTASDVANKYGMTPEQARYLMDKGYVFWSDGERIDTASGTTYTGSELKDMLSDNPSVQGNAQEGADDLAIFKKQQAESELEKEAAANKEMAAADKAKVEDLLNKPTDLSAVTQAYDNTIDTTRKAAARNKALALRGLQERGAYSGASVNQMMGQSTEAGYAYDTEAQQQEAMLNLQKEMAVANAAKEDADRKLSWAVALYQSSSNKAEADANWIKVQKWQEIANAAADRRARAEAEANSPGIGAYLAAGGIGVAGALGSIFSGGATGVAALGAISSILGSAGAMYGMSRGQQVQMPATNFNYQSAPGASKQSYQPIAGAPGTRDTYGVSHTGNASVRLGL